MSILSVPGMEQMALSCTSRGDVGAQNASMSLASPLYLGRSPSKAAQIRCLQWTRVLGFKGVRVYCQTGLGRGVGMRRCKPVAGSSDSRAKNRVVVAASSQEGSASSDVDVEKVRNELEKQADESEEAWKQSLDAFKDQASRMQGISKEAYAVYAEKAKIVLKDTTEQLKVQSEKMRAVLTSTAEEIRVKGKENLSIWIENVPETVKDVAETAIGVHPDDLKNLSKIHDFCLGIPYGVLLFVGGFLSFLITGSIPAVRFGVILGGIHLAASISSLKAWKKGDSSIPFVKGQAAIALIILLRESRVLCQRPSLIPGFFMSVFSAAILLFYSYIIFSERNQLKNVEPESSD